jgi:hypothetical protein
MDSAKQSGMVSQFAYESIFVDLPSLLSLRIPGRLRPHLLDVLKHHVAVAVEGLDTGEKLPIIAA